MAPARSGRFEIGSITRVLAFALALAVPAFAGAQTPIADDFDDGNDGGWTHYDPIGVGGWSFPGGGYRITAGSSADPELLTGRAGSYRADATIATFTVAARVTTWSAVPADQLFGVAARIANPGFETTDGYALLLRPTATPTPPTGTFSIVRLDNELTTFLDSEPVEVSPGPHRLVFEGAGSALTGRLYRESDGQLLATVEAVDVVYATGATGLLAFSGLLSSLPAGTADATFDDFAAVDSTADTDGDGLTDGAEVATHGSDPTDADTDDDGLTDGAEVNTHGTSPLDADTDDDGFSDAGEVNVWATSPLVPTPFPFTSAPAALNTNAAIDSGSDESVDLATDGAGNWVAVWRSFDTSGGIGTDYDILISRSSDAGASWTAPVPLNANATTDTGTDDFPALATDGVGNWVAVWDSTDTLGGTIGSDSDVLVARSSDLGATWTAPVPLNTNAATDAGHDGRPQLATDGAGNWVAVWVSSDTLGGTIGLDPDILVSRSADAGVTWTAPVALNANAITDTGADDSPALATDGAGNWVAVWTSPDEEDGDEDLAVSRSSNAGATWTAPAALNTNAATDSADDIAPKLATDGSGMWVAVWQTSDGGLGADADVLVARSSNQGTSWTDPVALNTNAASDSAEDEAPKLATDGTGRWVAVWQSLDADTDVLMSRSSNAGAAWTAPIPVHADAATDLGEDVGPGLATDGGRWVAVWASDHLGGTPGSDYDLAVTTSGPDADADGLATGAEAIYGSNPAVADTDGDGLTDGVEVATHRTNPTDPDTDDDGLTDAAEVNTHGTNPLADDTDGDGLEDGPEIDPYGTNPLLADTDADGISDGDEIAAGSNPFLPPTAIGDDFDDGNDDGWSRYNPVGVGTWSFPAGGYRIQAGAVANPNIFGPGRAGSTRASPAYGSFVVATEIVDWNAALSSQAFGVGARLSNLGLGSTDGYGLLVRPGGTFELLRLDGEEISVLSSSGISLSAGADYRLVFEGTGESLTGRIYNLASPSTPLDTLSTTDASHDSGLTGLVALDRSAPETGTADATFDDFVAVSPGADSDADGLADGPEVALHRTGPLDADSDDDGLLDGAEVNTYGSNPLDPDSDDDGLTDGAEVNTYATNPLDLDTDGDGMSDGYEIANGFAPTNPADGAQDLDADGLTNAQESAVGTAPNDADSDDDGASDGVEVLAYETNPLLATPFPFLGAMGTLNSNAAIDAFGDFEVGLGTDGAGSWVAVWRTNTGAGTGWEIVTSRSADNGLSWTPRAILSGLVGNDFDPHVATDGAGNWVVAWHSVDTLGGTIGSDADILVSRSTNNGQTWTAPAALNANAATDSGTDNAVEIATSGGTWIAVWHSTDTLGGTIGTDNDILVARSTNAGQTWSAPVAIHSNAAVDTGTDFNAHVAAGGSSTWVVAWQSNDTLGGTVGPDTDIFTTRSSNDGVSWVPVTALNTNATTDPAGDQTPRLATDGAGNWVAVWSTQATAGTDTDIMAARSSNGGATWTTPALLNTNAATDTGGDVVPDVATDGFGAWIATWQSSDALGGTIGTDNDVLVAHSTDAGATWTSPAPLHPNAATDSGSDELPAVAPGISGRWVAAWQSSDTLGGTIGTDYDILFTTSGGDADGDALDDGTEVFYDTDPDDPDTDGDALEDGSEIVTYGTDPLDPDTDDDGFTDGAEVQAGFDPLDPESVPPAPAIPTVGAWGLGALAALMLALGAAPLRRRAQPEERRGA